MAHSPKKEVVDQFKVALFEKNAVQAGHFFEALYQRQPLPHVASILIDIYSQHYVSNDYTIPCMMYLWITRVQPHRHHKRFAAIKRHPHVKMTLCDITMLLARSTIQHHGNGFNKQLVYDASVMLGYTSSPLPRDFHTLFARYLPSDLHPWMCLVHEAVVTCHWAHLYKLLNTVYTQYMHRSLIRKHQRAWIPVAFESTLETFMWMYLVCFARLSESPSLETGIAMLYYMYYWNLQVSTRTLRLSLLYTAFKGLTEVSTFVMYIQRAHSHTDIALKETDVTEILAPKPVDNSEKRKTRSHEPSDKGAAHPSTDDAHVATSESDSKLDFLNNFIPVNVPKPRQHHVFAASTEPERPVKEIEVRGGSVATEDDGQSKWNVRVEKINLTKV
jgi:hypothetical protein